MISSKLTYEELLNTIATEISKRKSKGSNGLESTFLKHLRLVRQAKDETKVFMVVELTRNRTQAEICVGCAVVLAIAHGIASIGQTTHIKHVGVPAVEAEDSVAVIFVETGAAAEVFINEALEVTRKTRTTINKVTSGTPISNHMGIFLAKMQVHLTLQHCPFGYRISHRQCITEKITNKEIRVLGQIVRMASWLESSSRI